MEMPSITGYVRQGPGCEQRSPPVSIDENRAILLHVYSMAPVKHPRIRASISAKAEGEGNDITLGE